MYFGLSDLFFFLDIRGTKRWSFSSNHVLGGNSKIGRADGGAAGAAVMRLGTDGLMAGSPHKGF